MADKYEIQNPSGDQPGQRAITPEVKAEFAAAMGLEAGIFTILQNDFIGYDNPSAYPIGKSVYLLNANTVPELLGAIGSLFLYVVTEKIDTVVDFTQQTLVTQSFYDTVNGYLVAVRSTGTFPVWGSYEYPPTNAQMESKANLDGGNTITGQQDFIHTSRPRIIGASDPLPMADEVINRADADLLAMRMPHERLTGLKRRMIPTAYAASVGHNISEILALDPNTTVGTYAAVRLALLNSFTNYTGVHPSFATPWIFSIQCNVVDIWADDVFRVGVGRPIISGQTSGFLSNIPMFHESGIGLEITRVGTNASARLVWYNGTYQQSAWVSLFPVSTILNRRINIIVQNFGNGTVHSWIYSGVESGATTSKFLANMSDVPTLTTTSAPTNRPTGNNNEYVGLVAGIAGSSAVAANGFTVVQIPNYDFEYLPQ